MLDELFLKLGSVEEHRCDRDNDHLLIDLMDLSEGFEDLWDDVVLLYLFLGLFMHTEISNCSDDIAKDLLFSLVVEQIEQYFEETLLK